MTTNIPRAKALGAGSINSGRQATVISAMLVIMLGALILFGVGMAQPEGLHNAAHDARHGFAVPCH